MYFDKKADQKSSKLVTIFLSNKQKQQRKKSPYDPETPLITNYYDFEIETARATMAPTSTVSTKMAPISTTVSTVTMAAIATTFSTATMAPTATTASTATLASTTTTAQQQQWL